MPNSRVYTEVATGITPNEAEALLIEAIQEYDDDETTRVRLEELAIEKLRIEQQSERTKLDTLKLLLETTRDITSIKEMMALMFK
jgi:hypothetical protein